MSPPKGRGDAAVLEHHLRRLDPARRGAFVADLWAARGYETRREGDVVVATRGDGSVVVAVDGEGADADVVVAPRGGVTAAGARVVDAAALREMLWYAVDSETATALCERHLGAAPGDLPPPLSARVRTRVARGVATVRGGLRAATNAGSVGTMPTLAIALVLVVGAVVAGGGGALTGTPAEESNAGGAVGATPAGGSVTSTAADGGRGVPGVTEDGIANLSALAEAHDRAVEGNSYTIWKDYHGPARGYAGAPRVHRDVDIEVDGDRYLGVVTLERRGDDEDERTPVQSVYYDGEDWYIAETDSGTERYRYVPASGGAPSLEPDPSTLDYTLVTRYLSTPETAVVEQETGDDDDDETLHRLVGRGRPVGFDDREIRNYTVVALVDETGFVRDLRAEYELVDGNETAAVTVEVTYGRVGTTTVRPPEWYEREFGGSATDDEASRRTAPALVDVVVGQQNSAV